jgi:hypothetical protein
MENRYESAWKALKSALIHNQKTGEGKIPGYINIIDTLCFMGVLAQQFELEESKLSDNAKK